MNRQQASDDLQKAYAEWRAGSMSREDFRDVVNAHGRMLGYFKCELMARQLTLCERKVVQPILADSQ